jgi:predicted ATPase
MKISISNFKAIKDLYQFEIKPFTILSGVNSTGKSSLIQLLLLLKQSIDVDSANETLVIDGDLFEVSDFEQIIYQKNPEKNPENKLRVTFDFDQNEFSRNVGIGRRTAVYNALGSYSCELFVEFDTYEKNIIVTEFSIKMMFEGKREDRINFATSKNGKLNYSIDTNTALFGLELLTEKREVERINFSSFFPRDYIYSPSKTGSFEISDFKSFIATFFQQISYIGPVRAAPEEKYQRIDSSTSVGTQGEFTAQILKELADNKVQFSKIIEDENGVIFKTEKATLLEAVNYWVCDVFKVAKKIYSEREEEIYRIWLENESGLTVSIKHVGFGISQILPIIVEGLRLLPGEFLILEQPEAQLHPKLQSQLFDFLYSLILQGKNVFLETHSDHLITRMRRRIAEDYKNEMSSKINLTFIESKNGALIFRRIDFDELGTMDIFPKDFMEQTNIELKAIIDAQMRKRTKQ